MDTRGGGNRPVNDHQAVVFRLGDSTYGIDIERVSKVMRMRAITPCAREGSALCGIVNIKGRTIPVYDLSQVLDAKRTRETAKSRIIVTESENGSAAFVVDAVTSVVDDAAHPPAFAIVDLDAALAKKTLVL